MGIINVFDATTGCLLGILEGAYITGIRTGAAGAIGAKYLARKDSETLFILGAGNQAAYQIAATITEFPALKKVYGPDTDKLIVNLYRVKRYAPHFSITEFRCHCGGKYCTGYPAYLSVKLLKNLEAVRVKFGPTTVTSGIRCKKWNSLQTGSAGKSRHISGKAADIAGAFTKTNAARNKVKAFWYTLPGANFCYHGTRNMGNAVHCDVR